MRFLTGLGAFVLVSALEALFIGFVVITQDPETPAWVGVAVGAIITLAGINVLIGMGVGRDA